MSFKFTTMHFRDLKPGDAFVIGGDRLLQRFHDSDLGYFPGLIRNNHPQPEVDLWIENVEVTKLELEPEGT